ncbi:disulfide bond formation protein B [Microvirga antarctica]|uniref:disulfide bond formation protein B n=1 Tax=Microvirga antarctica TaxID=2819233 RepID=UPI003CCEE406
MPVRLTIRQACLVVALAAAATIGGALVFQYGYGYQPCKLCLEQRYPYYFGIPLALLGVVLPQHGGRAILWLLALLFLASAALGTYHAGVEWGWWLGPSDCGGGGGAAGGSVGDLLNQLNKIRVVSCTEAAWRFLGLSLAGWNVLISLALAALSGVAARRG